MILIIERSTEVLDRLIQIVSEIERPKTIFKATGFEETLLLLEDIKPKIVLLDSCLPEHKSIDLLKKIKTDYTTAKVIILSNNPDVRYERHYLSMGADVFLDKYHDYEKLPELINNIYCDNELPVNDLG